MIYQVETFVSDNHPGATIMRRRVHGERPMDSKMEYAADQFQFSGYITYGVKMPNGEVVRERELLAFAIEAANVEEAWAKMPDMYTAACKKFMTDMEADVQKAKEAELRAVLMGEK